MPQAPHPIERGRSRSRRELATHVSGTHLTPMVTPTLRPDVWTPEPGSPQARALAHVAARSVAPPAERPKYGSLNFRRRATGGAPRFGSAYFRLRPEVLLRTTFCYPDSAYEPEDFGVADRMALIPLAARDSRRDPLDWSIEAHVHGPVRLALDAEVLVLDPCYRDTDTEVLARALPCPIEWHPGFRLSITELRRHPEYRGPEYVDLGVALARDRELTPAIIGAAARAGRHDPQDLKKVWHYLARFGDLSAVEERTM